MCAYRYAIQHVCNAYVRSIKREHYPKFTEVQKKLDEHGIAYDRYAITVTKIYWKWMRRRNLRTVPTNVFCSAKAWDKFLAMQDTTVRLETNLDTDWNRAVYCELNAATVYIGELMVGKGVSLPNLRKLQRIKYNEDVVSEVIGLLNMLYECDCDCYNDIADVARNYYATSIHSD